MKAQSRYFDNLPGLHEFPKPLKIFLLAFLFLLTSGVTTGLIYLFQTTGYSPGQTLQHYKGSPVDSQSDMFVQEKYPKTLSELLLTTHNHWIGFAFIFFILGTIFYLNTVVKGSLKSFLIIEPFISSWLTFAAIWLMRFWDANFVYLAIVSAVITYVSFYLIASIIIYDLFFQKPANLL